MTISTSTQTTVRDGGTEVTTPDNRLHVVVGVIPDSQGRLLLQQRRPGTPKAGQWEFPGGKLEPGETPETALAREIEEELGVQIVRPEPLATLPYDYVHAQVWLDTWLIPAFLGRAVGREGQRIAWVPAQAVPQYDVLEAVHPILEAFQVFQAKASHDHIDSP